MAAYIHATDQHVYIYAVAANVPSIEYSDDAEEKIKSFATLPRGWDYGHGGPIPEKTLRSARAWNVLLRDVGFTDTDAFPGGANEVVVAGSCGDHYVEVIVEPGGLISVAYDYKRKQAFYKPNLSEDEAEQIVRALARGLWSASDYFTRISITRNSASSLDLLSGTSPAAYPLLSGTVYDSQVNLLRTMSGNTTSATPGLWGNLPYSGNLTPASPFLPGMWSNRSPRIQEIFATMT